MKQFTYKCLKSTLVVKWAMMFKTPCSDETLGGTGIYV